ncbi:MAG TPA: hypothetical protein VH816_15545 [Gaiellaceae bacterium]
MAARIPGEHGDVQVVTGRPHSGPLDLTGVSVDNWGLLIRRQSELVEALAGQLLDKSEGPPLFEPDV